MQTFSQKISAFISKRLPAAGLVTFCLCAPALALMNLNQADQQELAAYQKQFQSIRSQAQLLAAYRKAHQISKRLEPKLEKYTLPLLEKGQHPSDADLAALAKRVPGLSPDLVAEGTVIALQTDLAAYAKAAAKTPEAADNSFFALMTKAYGPVRSDYGNWFLRTWDYGGCSWLGNGLHSQLFKGLQQQRAAKSPFGPELTELENHLLIYLEQQNVYCLPKAKALQEYQQLIPLAPAPRRPALQQRLKRLQSGEGQREGMGEAIQFGYCTPEMNCPSQ